MLLDMKNLEALKYAGAGMMLACMLSEILNE